jgi:hypothetical protein
MSKKVDHLHKYKRVKLSPTYTVYKCMEPSCTHYIRPELVEGKLCQCNRCGEPMTMDKLAMTLAKPHCKACTKSPKGPIIEVLGEYLDNL